MSIACTLITGATGFIGSHVAEQLLRDESWPVIAIVRGGKGYKNTDVLKQQGAHLLKGCFYEPDLLDSVFRRFPIENVIHIAGLTGEGKGDWEDYFGLNVLGTEALLSAAYRHKAKKFIYFSSVGVFGTTPVEVPADLKTPEKADNTYHRSKLTAEEKVRGFIEKGLDAFIVRPTIVYGNGDHGFPYRLVKMVRNRVLFLPFHDNRIHLLSVNSLSEMALRLLKTDRLHNRVFIAADEGPVVLRELVDLIHSYFFGRNYPGILKMPRAVFEVFQTVFRMTRNLEWLGRVQRISGDWCFDTRETDTLIQFQPANTQKEFKRYLNHLK